MKNTFIPKSLVLAGVTSTTLMLSGMSANTDSILIPTDNLKYLYNYAKDEYSSISSKSGYEKDEYSKINPKSNIAIKKIKSFIHLYDNWDSYGAEKVTDQAIISAIDFIEKADNNKLFVYFCSPGRNGDVLVEYKLSENISMEVYFNKDSENEYYIYNGNECINEGIFKKNYNDLIKLSVEYYPNES